MKTIFAVTKLHHENPQPPVFIQCLVLVFEHKQKRQEMCSHLAAACWDGRSASQRAGHSSSGWLSHSAQSTYWLSLKYWSSSPSSTRCLRRGTQQRDGTGIRGPWGSRWPRCHRRGPSKSHQSCSKDMKGPHQSLNCSSNALKGIRASGRIKV